MTETGASEASPVLAVDGPGGAGKGTLCAAIAAAYGWHLLDSGAIYRLLGLKVRQTDTDIAKEADVAALARQLDIRFEPSSASGLVSTSLDGVDVSSVIRTETAGTDASLVAAMPSVRDALLQRQRDFRKSPGLVADGRDMGTVVFTDAQLKIFLTASVEERAQRRHKQLIQQGVDANLARLSAEIAERDRRDTERSSAPLKPATDAVMVDTSEMTITDVVGHVMQRMAAQGFT
jgi:cytidylate kinase